MGVLSRGTSVNGVSPTLEDTFLELYDNEGRAVLGYLRAVVNNDFDAEDLAAETFLRAWKGWSKYQHTDRPVRHWLLKIARNLAVDRARTRAKVRVLPLTEAVASTGNSSDATNRIQLLSALRSVPPDDRELLALRATGLRFAEVAAVVGKTEPAVRMAWHRAARKLRERLER